jgi:hypothetical protein
MQKSLPYQTYSEAVSAHQIAVLCYCPEMLNRMKSDFHFCRVVLIKQLK